MPKQKTNSSAKKRFRKIAKGLYKVKAACRNHGLRRHNAKWKSDARLGCIVKAADHRSIKRLLKDV